MSGFSTSGATKGSGTVRRFEVLAGPERRRRYTAEEKAALVAESLEPGACAAAIARRHGLHPQQLYTWRRRAKRGELFRQADEPMFAAVALEADDSLDGAASPSWSDEEIAVEVGGVAIRIGPAVPVERAAALVAALRRRG